MELWIRSQDKEQLIKVDNLNVFHNTVNCETINFIIKNNFDDLGSYATKERALEILDEIQNKINNYIAEIYMARAIYVGESQKPTYIYEMPKD